MRILCLDFGKKRIGIAISDVRKMIASPLFVHESVGSLKETASAIKEKLTSYLPLEGIVLGLPLHLSGEESDMSRLTRQFGEILKEIFTAEIIFWDERLTTSLVERAMKESGLTRKKRARHLDKLAATAILQNYLDSR